MKNSYNFKQVLEHPIVLYRLGKWVLPFGIQLARVLLFFSIFIFMLILNKPINAIIPHSAQAITFLGIPFLLSHYLLKFRKDGKKIHNFLYDFFQYFFTIYLPQKKYCNDQQVLYTNNTVSFEPVYMKKGANINEVENTNETDIQKPIINRKRRHMGILQDNARGYSTIR